MLLNLKTVFVKLLILFLVFNICVCQNSSYLSIGDFPEYQSFGINTENCGLIYPMPISNILFPKDCFLNFVENITFYHSSRDKNNIENSPKNRVYKGSPVPRGMAPWVVLIDDSLSIITSAQCTGVLITLEWVLTAAHCEWSTNKFINVFAGSNRRKHGMAIEVKPDKFIRHPIYLDQSSKTDEPEDSDAARYFKYGHDIALYKLKSKFNIMISKAHTPEARYEINTICLPKATIELNRVPERATLYGWGLKDSKGDFWNEISNVLLKAEIELNPHWECDRLNAICVLYNNSYDGPKGCPGDSGGPLVKFLKRNKVMPTRAVSMGVLIGSSHVDDWTIWSVCRNEIIKDDLFIATTKFIDWILQTITNN